MSLQIAVGQCRVRLHVMPVMCTVGFPEQPKPTKESVRESERDLFDCRCRLFPEIVRNVAL